MRCSVKHPVHGAKVPPTHIQSLVTHAGLIEFEHVNHELIFNSTHLENSELGHVYRAPEG